MDPRASHIRRPLVNFMLAAGDAAVLSSVSFLLHLPPASAGLHLILAMRKWLLCMQVLQRLFGVGGVGLLEIILVCDT